MPFSPSPGLIDAIEFPILQSLSGFRRRDHGAGNGAGCAAGGSGDVAGRHEESIPFFLAAHKLAVEGSQCNLTEIGANVQA